LVSILTFEHANPPGWESLSLARVVEAGLPGLPGLAVSTGNDVRAAALAEARWGRLRGVRNGLYVNVGTGLGAAVVLDSRPMAITLLDWLGLLGGRCDWGVAVAVEADAVGWGEDGEQVVVKVRRASPTA
jgi:hypothetical protein